MFGPTRPTTRLLALLELLQAHGTLTGADLAARLEVAPRSVRRYVERLQEIGIPVEARRGRHGGYRLRPGFRLPPLMFTNEEAVAVALGLLAGGRLGLGERAGAAEGAFAKLARVLPLELRERVAALRESIDVASPATVRPGPDPATLLALSGAAGEGRSVRIAYRSAAGVPSERTLDPYGLALHEGAWYVAGWDHLRGALRTFRVERIARIGPAEGRFARPSGFRTLDVVLRSIASAPWRWEVEVLLRTTLADAAERVPRSFGALEETPEGVVVYGRAERLDGLARMLAALDRPFVVRRPPELRDALRRLADELRAAADAP